MFKIRLSVLPPNAFHSNIRFRHFQTKKSILIFQFACQSMDSLSRAFFSISLSFCLFYLLVAEHHETERCSCDARFLYTHAYTVRWNIPTRVAKTFELELDLIGFINLELLTQQEFCFGWKSVKIQFLEKKTLCLENKTWCLHFPEIHLRRLLFQPS